MASQIFKSVDKVAEAMEVNHDTLKLTRTLSTKVTESEDQRIRAYSEAQGYELSAFVRRTLVAAVEGKALRPVNVMHLEIFVRTMEAWLEMKDRFTLENFREICAMVTAKSNAPPKPVSNGMEKDA
jgi:hypothetical protein